MFELPVVGRLPEPRRSGWCAGGVDVAVRGLLLDAADVFVGGHVAVAVAAVGGDDGVPVVRILLRDLLLAVVGAVVADAELIECVQDGAMDDEGDADVEVVVILDESADSARSEDDTLNLRNAQVGLHHSELVRRLRFYTQCTRFVAPEAARWLLH